MSSSKKNSSCAGIFSRTELVGKSGFETADASLGRGEKFACGEFIDITPYAKAIGFVSPVALHRDAWAAIDAWIAMDARTWRTKERRILEVLMVAASAARKSTGADSVQFSLYGFTGKKERGSARTLAIKNDFLIRFGSDEEGEPAIAISLFEKSGSS